MRTRCMVHGLTESHDTQSFTRGAMRVCRTNRGEDPCRCGLGQSIIYDFFPGHQRLLP